MSTYSEKLKDPRWQKKRLEILERDNWTCQICEDTDRTLHVHHLRYVGEPWETPDKYLETLCELCHEEEHELRKAGKRIGAALRGHLYGPEAEDLAKAFEAMADMDLGVEVVLAAVGWAISSMEEGAAAARMDLVERYSQHLREVDDG